jgi:hypothetical protein
MAIDRAVRKHKIELAQLYSFATSEGVPEWRVAPRRNIYLQESSGAHSKPNGEKELSPDVQN